jgi:hypothetical protein
MRSRNTLPGTARGSALRLWPLHRAGAPATGLDGDAIRGSGTVCTAGFNVTVAAHPAVLTAGHCTQKAPYWRGLGPTLDSRFPGRDYGIIRDTRDRGPALVNLHDGTTRSITAAGRAHVGEHVCKSGAASGLTCGIVTGVGETVSYAGGTTVHGLIATSLHAAAGDSGAPLFHGHTGLGILSGGSGSVEYFQPLLPALHAYHASLARPAGLSS